MSDDTGCMDSGDCGNDSGGFYDSGQCDDSGACADIACVETTFPDNTDTCVDQPFVTYSWWRLLLRRYLPAGVFKSIP